MNALLIIGIIIVVILVVILGGYNYFLITKNNAVAVQQTLKPFTAKIDPTTGNISKGGFKGQLSCPVGTKIEIVSAFYDIDDPYNTCSSSLSQVNPLVAFMCNPSASSPGTCSKDSDCPKTTECKNNKCVLKAYSKGYTCTSEPNTTPLIIGDNTYCVNTNICSTGVPNKVCMPSGTGGCAIRDASANVAQKCNGREDCDDLSENDFGETPCNLKPIACYSKITSNGPQWNSGRSGYCGLPYGPGWGGGAPDYGSNSDSESGNLGYTMHGIYNCISN